MEERQASDKQATHDFLFFMGGGGVLECFRRESNVPPDLDRTKRTDLERASRPHLRVKAGRVRWKTMSSEVILGGLKAERRITQSQTGKMESRWSFFFLFFLFLHARSASDARSRWTGKTRRRRSVQTLALKMKFSCIIFLKFRFQPSVCECV